MEDPGAFYVVTLNNPTLRRGLVAEAHLRQGRRRLGWSGVGGQTLRRTVASALRTVAVRLEPEPRRLFAETAGVRP